MDGSPDLSGSSSEEEECGEDDKSSVLVKRRKRKKEGLTTVPCKLRQTDVTCCIHISSTSSEDPHFITADTLRKMNEVRMLLKPLNDEQLEVLGPQANVIRKKLDLIPDMTPGNNLKACKSCQNKVKKNYKRYDEKLKKVMTEENEVIEVESSKIPSPAPTMKLRNVSREKVSTDAGTTADTSSATNLKKSTRLLPQDRCFICDNWRVYHNKRYHTRLQKVEIEDRGVEKSLRTQATLKRDCAMLAKLETYDLLAREAVYHKVCYDNYRHRYDLKKEKSKAENAADTAFTEVRNYVDRHVFAKSEIATMDVLADIYWKGIWGNTDISVDRGTVRKQTKSRLVKFYKTSLSFETHPVDGDICFDSSLTTGQLALKIYHHRKSSEEIVREAGLLVRNEMQQFFKGVDEPPYPPQIKDLTRYEVPKDSLLISLNSHILLSWKRF